MKDKKTVLFSAFRGGNVVPANFENWFERMAAEGWHVDRIRQWNSLWMTFKKGEPRKYRFVCDMQFSERKEYRATYEQFGWQFLGRMASFRVWRMEYQGQRPEAFTDKESVVARNRRTVQAVSVSFTLFLIMSIFYAVWFIFFPDSLSAGDRTQIIAAEAVFLVCAILLGIVMLRIWRNRRR
ncbi:MAG: DUF2812 domain-containing protein [Dehalococcoidia bacterium]|jgi:hypothetical protein